MARRSGQALSGSRRWMVAGQAFPQVARRATGRHTATPAVLSERTRRHPVSHCQKERDNAPQSRAPWTHRDSGPPASLRGLQPQRLLGARGSIRHADHRPARPRGLESQRTMRRLRAMRPCPYVHRTGHVQANRGVTGYSGATAKCLTARPDIERPMIGACPR